MTWVQVPWVKGGTTDAEGFRRISRRPLSRRVPGFEYAANQHGFVEDEPAVETAARCMALGALCCHCNRSGHG